MSPQTTAESTAVSIASPMVKRNATTVPRMAGGIAKDEHRRSVIRLDGMLYGPDPKILTLESNTGAAAGIKVTSGLIEGSGGGNAPPAEDPAYSRQGSAGPASDIDQHPPPPRFVGQGKSGFSSSLSAQIAHFER
jgi:hypothetical protein